MNSPRRKVRLRRMAVVLVCVCCAVLLWGKFLGGNIRIESDLLCNETFEKISQNWERLIENDKAWEHPLHKQIEGATEIQYYGDKEAKSVTLYVYPAGTVSVDEPTVVYAKYKRAGIKAALSGYWRLGECEVMVCVAAPTCAIYAILYDTSANDDSFIALLEEILRYIEE